MVSLTYWSGQGGPDFPQYTVNILQPLPRTVRPRWADTVGGPARPPPLLVPAAGLMIKWVVGRLTGERGTGFNSCVTPHKMGTKTRPKQADFILFGHDKFVRNLQEKET